MAYPLYHRVHSDFEDSDLDIEPDFYDIDGSPVYEKPYGGLLMAIVARNDLVALQLYKESSHRRVFWEAYELQSWHPLIVAARSRSFDALRALLEIYLADPRYTEPLDKYLKQIPFSPINVACAAAHKELTLWLLHHNPPLATLHDQDSYGKTPPFSAASGLQYAYNDSSNCDGAIAARELSKHEDFICFLLDQGCSVPDSNIYAKLSESKEEQTPDFNHALELEKTVLGAAIPRASYQMVSRLVAEGAKVHAWQSWSDFHSWDHPTTRIQDAKRVTALHIATLFGNLEGIRALVNHRGDVSMAEMVSSADDQGRLPLHWAALGNQVKGVDDMIDVNIPDENPARKMDALRLLLEANPNTINVRDRRGATVFNYAVRSDAGIASILSTVKMLLDAKPLASTLKAPGNPLVDGPTALEDAVDRHARRLGNVRDEQFTELVETLLTNGADAHLCLHRLCEGQWRETISPDMIDRLLETTDINDTDANGRTAMHCLVKHLDQIDAARHLISREADVTVVDHNGNTPLHEVVHGKMPRRVDENGIPDPMPHPDGPVRERAEWIKILVDAGGSMDQPNAAGKTPTQLIDELTEQRQQRNIAWGIRGGRGRGRGTTGPTDETDK